MLKFAPHSSACKSWHIRADNNGDEAHREYEVLGSCGMSSAGGFHVGILPVVQSLRDSSSCHRAIVCQRVHVQIAYNVLRTVAAKSVGSALSACSWLQCA